MALPTVNLTDARATNPFPKAAVTDVFSRPQAALTAAQKTGAVTGARATTLINNDRDLLQKIYDMLVASKAIQANIAKGIKDITDFNKKQAIPPQQDPTTKAFSSENTFLTLIYDAVLITNDKLGTLNDIGEDMLEQLKALNLTDEEILDWQRKERPRGEKGIQAPNSRFTTIDKPTKVADEGIFGEFKKLILGFLAVLPEAIKGLNDMVQALTKWATGKTLDEWLDRLAAGINKALKDHHEETKGGVLAPDPEIKAFEERMWEKIRKALGLGPDMGAGSGPGGASDPGPPDSGTAPEPAPAADPRTSPPASPPSGAGSGPLTIPPMASGGASGTGTATGTRPLAAPPGDFKADHTDPSSEDIARFIKPLEGTGHHKAYRDGKHLVIGYGHNVAPSEMGKFKDIGGRSILMPSKVGDPILPEDAILLLKHDLETEYIPDTIRAVGGERNWKKLSKNEKIVLTDYYYNAGGKGKIWGSIKNVLASTDSDTVIQAVIMKDLLPVSEGGMGSETATSGKKAPGLKKRRITEAKLANEGKPIPGLSKGGIVTEPTMVMVGEAGPEAVIPLTTRDGAALVPGSLKDSKGSVLSGVSASAAIKVHRGPAISMPSRPSAPPMAAPPMHPGAGVHGGGTSVSASPPPGVARMHATT